MEKKIKKIEINTTNSIDVEGLFEEQKKEKEVAHTEFIKLNKKILDKFSKGLLSLYEGCCLLNEMRESRLYVKCGYLTFENYCFDNFGIKKSQAYSYTKIAETYTKEFFQSTGKIGVEKMLLLSKLSPEERDEVVESNDLESMNVKEVKEVVETVQFDEKEIDIKKQLNIKGNAVIKNLNEIIEKLSVLPEAEDIEPFVREFSKEAFTLIANIRQIMTDRKYSKDNLSSQLEKGE